MSTTTLPRPAVVETDLPSTGSITIYGDFTCPWSYLAFRRAEVLAADGAEIEWRAVGGRPPASGGSSSLRGDVNLVVSKLLPGEELPLDIPAFRPRTAPAVGAYAEGYAAGVPMPVARVLFESFWLHGIDIGDLHVLRTLLTGQLRGSASPSQAIREWGAPLAADGAPMSAAACRHIRDWSREWRDLGAHPLPALRSAHGRTLYGVEAVDWLGGRITELGLNPDEPARTALHCWHDELPPMGWASVDGGRWHRRYQRCGTR